MFLRLPAVLLVIATLLAAQIASAAEIAPSADDLLKKYDAIMGPENFESLTEMSAHREDDSTRTYKMKVLKAGTEKFRLWFQEPAAVRGQEMLRQGENLWVYLPNLKKPTRLASRESFQGGDFNNADVLRVHYQTDYAARVLLTSSLPDSWELELRAKTGDAAYDRIKLWMRRADLMPVKGEYYSASGKMLRLAEFSEVKSFGGFKRPARIVMKNMLATKRFSVMTLLTLNVKVTPPASRFVLDDLGR
jgi:outer membrane lipoprotein-sorting protein